MSGKTILDHSEIREKMKDKKKTARSAVDSKLLANSGLPYNHRIVAYMAAQGCSRGTICEMLEFTNPNNVTNILGKPSVKKAIEKIQHQFFFMNPVKAYGKIFPQALETAHKIMMDDKQKGGVRLKAAHDFQDRHIGKPVQKIEHEETLVSVLIARLDDTAKVVESIAVKDDNQVIDVPVDAAAEPKQDSTDFSAWVDENL